MTKHLFIAGVPATGKTWLGSWLAAERGYRHIGAEKNDGIDF
jgi:shikimate kinase